MISSLLLLFYLLNLNCSISKPITNINYRDNAIKPLQILIHSCDTCKGLKQIISKENLIFNVKNTITTIKAFSSYSNILYTKWDIIFIGMNSNGCGNTNEATFIHEMRYLSHTLFKTQPIFILIADKKNQYTCKTRSVIKYLDVDGIIHYYNANRNNNNNYNMVSPPFIDLDTIITNNNNNNDNNIDNNNNNNIAISNFIQTFLNKNQKDNMFRVWRPRLGIIHFRTKSTPWDAFEVGFTSAIRTLEKFYVVTWVNVDDWQGLKIEDVNIKRFNTDFDILFVKSNWHWTVDTFVRTYMRNIKTPVCLLISGVASPPEADKHLNQYYGKDDDDEDDEIHFYNVLFYETEWYKPQIQYRHRIIQRAFGIDTNIMYDRNITNKTIDSLFIGWMANYKRPWLFAKHLTGGFEDNDLLMHNKKKHHEKYNIIAIGKHDGTPEGPSIVNELRQRGIKVLPEVSYRELAKLINQAKEVHIPSTELGGGERAILESKACGVPSIRIEDDNLKLKELLNGPTLSHHAYAKMLHKGISKLYVSGINSKSKIYIKDIATTKKYHKSDATLSQKQQLLSLDITLKLRNYNINNKMQYFGLGESGKICCHISTIAHEETNYNYSKCYVERNDPNIEILNDDTTTTTTTTLIVTLPLVVLKNHHKQLDYLNITCTLQSSFYDMDYEKSNWKLFNIIESMSSNSYSTMKSKENDSLEDGIEQQKNTQISPQNTYNNTQKNIIYNSNYNRDQQNKNILVIYDSMELLQNNKRLDMITDYVEKLSVYIRSFLYRVHVYDIHGKIQNPATYPKLELNDFDFNNIDYRQVDLMIAFGEFNGSSDYLIAFLHHNAQTKNIPKIYVHLNVHSNKILLDQKQQQGQDENVKALKFSIWTMETYCLLICTTINCMENEIFQEHQNLIDWESPLLFRKIKNMIRNDHNQLFNINTNSTKYKEIVNDISPTCMTKRSLQSKRQYIKNGDWSIGIYRGKTLDSIQPIEEYLLTNPSAFPSSLSKCNASMIKNPIIHSDHINDIPSIFVADPFIILKEGTNELYIFFESLDYAFRGFIGVLVSYDNGFTWKYLGVTLEESFHLSFPYVFYDQLSKNYYMIPESHRSKSIRLYETDATTFPFGWTLNKELLTGNFYQDTGIIHHNNIWYLFTTTTIQPKDWRMELYLSTDLNGDYTKHPASPITSVDDGCIKGRLGGRLLTTFNAFHRNNHKNKEFIIDRSGYHGPHTGIIRFSQGAEPFYGNSLYANLIIELTPYVYKEKTLLNNKPIIKGSGLKNTWNENMMHHFDAVYVDGEYVVVVDGGIDGKGLKCE